MVAGICFHAAARALVRLGADVGHKAF
uniref:Uncharacterized protein n=1 Tax=Anguilla anguilla TaxID=7936 RepID=A0A0E9R5J6_ANGAN